MCRNSSRAVPAALFSVNSATKTAKKTGTSSVGKTLASKTQDKLIERASVVRCSRGFAEAALLRRKYAVMKDDRNRKTASPVTNGKTTQQT